MSSDYELALKLQREMDAELTSLDGAVPEDDVKLANYDFKMDILKILITFRMTYSHPLQWQHILPNGSADQPTT